MSLINEALRKARQAASEHDAKPLEGPFQPAKAYPSRGPGRRGGLLLMSLIAVAAGVSGAVAAWWILGDHETVSNSPAIEAATSMATPVVVPTPFDDRAPAAPHEVPLQQESVPAEVEQPVIESTPAVAEAEESTTDSDGNRVFVMEAKIGGVTLSLGYIVARTTNPFAEINGTDVWIGSEIEGFVVEAIEADRIILRDDKGLLILRVP